jgi:protein-tyrosine phosphatase
LRALAEEQGQDDDLYIDSAGIGAWHVGEQPDRRMRKHAAQRGYDLSSLRARQFRSDDFEKFDWIVVMDEENYQDVMRKVPSYTSSNKLAKVVRMKDFFNDFKGYDHVPDPYYGGSEGFELALDMIEDGCKEMLKSLQQKV